MGRRSPAPSDAGRDARWLAPVVPRSTEPGSLSVFSQRLDRVAFVAYFLGAVVPLVALGAVVQHYRLADQGDSYSSLQLVAIVSSICFLSLGCFLMLRRTTTRSIDRIERNQRRLVSLLSASGSLVHAEHPNEVADVAARTGLTLTHARAAFVLLRSRSGPLRLAGRAGGDSQEIFAWLEEPLTLLGNVVMNDRSPAVYGGREPDGREEHAVAAAVVAPIPGDVEPFGVIAAVHTESANGFDANEVDSLVTLAGLTSVALRNAELRDDQRNFFSHVTDMLLMALDRHLAYHEGHGERVSEYATRVAHEMELPADRRQSLYFGALLHDIGMIRIDRSLIHSAKACRKHPIFGFRMLEPIRLWQPAARIVLHHHEWYDGSGYPAGLAGEQIPLEARVVSVCESLDAMISETSYSPPLPLDAAIRELEEGAGTQFDPAIVRVVLRLIERGDIDPTGT